MWPATPRPIMLTTLLGAPIDVFPLGDNPEAGADPKQNNDFQYTFPNDQETQDRCPFAGHTRKTNPRADLPPGATESRRIIRRGIQFGPEVTREEAASGRTKLGRCVDFSFLVSMRIRSIGLPVYLRSGLIFVSYQSNIANGFQFIQESMLHVSMNALWTLY